MRSLTINKIGISLFLGISLLFPQSSMAQNVTFSSKARGNLQVGMPGIPFTVSVVNKGSSLNGCALRIYQQAGVTIMTPTATLYKSSGAVVPNAAIYSASNKQFNFSSPLENKDSVVIAYTGVASGEAIALANNVRNDSLIFTSGAYRLAQLSNPPRYGKLSRTKSLLFEINTLC
jgi:hypothetical protein